MFDHNEPKHESADEIWNRSSWFSDLLYELGSDWKWVGNTQKWTFEVLEIIIPLDLLLDLRIIVLKLDKFISSCSPTHIEHDRVSGICSKVGEHRMSWEVYILEAIDLAVIWWCLNRKYQILESLDANFDMGVFSTLLSQAIHLLSEFFSFDSFLVLSQVGSLGVSGGCSFLLVCKVINFFENNQHVNDVANLLSKFFAFCSLFYDELSNCSRIKSIENLPNEFFLN